MDNLPHGNVWEWVWDWYGSYPSGPVANPLGAATSSGRVGRGGSWYVNAWHCRAACRLSIIPGGRIIDLGFRLSRSI